MFGYIVIIYVHHCHAVIKVCINLTKYHGGVHSQCVV